MRIAVLGVLIAAVGCGTEEAPSPGDAADALPETVVVDYGLGDVPDVVSETDAAKCTLTDSGPVTVTSDGQIVERLRITSTAGTALTIAGHANVVVRDVEILHCGGSGIDFSSASNLHVSNVSIRDTCAPAKGAFPDGVEEDGIHGYDSTGVVIDHVRLEKESSGAYLLQCAGVHLSFVEGHDFRGPFPRGQLAQFDKCDAPILEDFSSEDPPDSSWPEDVVSVYFSNGAIVRRGLVDGNNSSAGVGVMFEHSDDGTCEDVDAVHQADGCFSSYPGNRNVFRRTRARDNFCTDQGRGAPLSGGLAWAGSPDSTHLSIEASQYHALCKDQHVWDETVFDGIDLTDVDFTPRPPLRLSFCWE